MFLVNFFFIFIVWLSSYFQGKDLAVAVCYLYITWKAGEAIGHEPARTPLMGVVIASLLAQLPGWILAAANFYSYFARGGIPEVLTYIFLLWHTPFVPFLTFFSFPTASGYASYFLALFALPPLYTVVMLAGYAWKAITPLKPAAPRGKGAWSATNITASRNRSG